MNLDFLEKAAKSVNLKIFYKLQNKNPVIKNTNYLTYVLVEKKENQTIFGKKIEFECQLNYSNNQDNLSILQLFIKFYNQLDLDRDLNQDSNQDQNQNSNLVEQLVIEKVNYSTLTITGSFMDYGEITYV